MPGHVDASEQLRSLQAVKIEGQGFAVVDDAERAVGLSAVQICQFAKRQDFHLDVRMETREIGEVRHEQVCREGRCQCHAQKPARALVATKDARLQLVRRRFHLLRELEDLLARSRQAVARRQLFEHERPEAFLKLGDASQYGRVVHTKALGGSPHRASARDGKKVANVIPVDHGAIQHHAVRLPKPVSNEWYSSTGVQYNLFRRTRPNSERRTPIVAAGVSRPAGSISHHRCARFRTQRLTPADLCRGSRVAPERPEAEAWKEKSWESLRVRLQSSRAALPA